MAQIKHLFIISGEPSGDLNAAGLVVEILKINPKINISGVGGVHLRKTGSEILYDIKELAVIGFFDVLRKLPQFLSLKNLILQKIESSRPDAIILVDFSGFNLRLARAINKKIPVIYYVSPQVWASRKGRVNTIKDYVSKMFVLFKFEEEFYKKYGVAADFVGHPLLETAVPSMAKKEFLSSLKLSDTKTTIALLPGSRRQEIENILPLMLKTALLLDKEMGGLQFIIAKSSALGWEIYNHKVEGLDLALKIVEGKTCDCLNAADFSLIASGTATLEATIMQKPFAVIYKMGLLNYLLYLPQVKIPYIGLANIIAGKKIVPEFIQFRARPTEIARKVLGLLKSPQELVRMRENLSLAASSLGEKGAAHRAAKKILDFLNNN
ncbi:MAG: lipid-A-disaccharide synthase [Candidatus Omnitrophota bacterium]